MDKISEFFSTGNNLYYVIAAAVALVIIVAGIVVGVKLSKKKKAAAFDNEAERSAAPTDEADTYSDADAESVYDSAVEGEIDVDKLVVRSESDYSPEVNANIAIRLPVKYESEDVDSVVPAPVKNKERKPGSKPVEVSEEPAEKETSFKEHVHSPEAGRRPGTIQIYRDMGGKYRFRLKTSNGETIGHSQGYTSKEACKNGIKSVVNAARIATKVDSTREDYVPTIGKTTFVIYRDRENKFRFRLTAANTSNILASQGYTTKANCINGTESVRNVAAFHNLSDATKKSS